MRGEQLDLFSVAGDTPREGMIFSPIPKKIVLKSLRVKNFRNVHGLHTLDFRQGINIVVPEQFDTRDMDDCQDFAWMVNPAHQMYSSDIIDLLWILKGEKDFNELKDFSFFAEENKDMSVEAEFENAKMKSANKYIRRKTYRQGEVNARFRHKEQEKFDKFDNVELYRKEMQNYWERIKIYPEEIDTSLWRIRYVNNLDYLLKDFPTLDIPRLINDFNKISYEYSLGGKLVADETGSIRFLNTLSYQSDWRSSSEDRKNTLKELAMLIAIEKQVKSDVVILSYRFGISQLHEKDLTDALDMLKEFGPEQQVIAFYNSFYFIWDWEDVIYHMRLNNAVAKRDGLEPVYHWTKFTEKYKEEKDWERTTIKQAARELIYRQQQSLEVKERLAIDIIKSAILQTRAKIPCIANSAGKDSVVLTDLVMRAVDELKATYGERVEFLGRSSRLRPHQDFQQLSIGIMQDLVGAEDRYYCIPTPYINFNDTGVEFPEHIKFSRELFKSYEERGYKVYIAKPETTFFKIVKEYGYPLFGKGVRQKSHPEVVRLINELQIRTCHNRCCELLKEEPARRIHAQLGVDLIFLGLLASESQERKKLWYRMGDTYWNKKEEMYKCLPIIHFQESDIWAYIEKYQLPVSPVYSMGYWATDKDGNDAWIHYRRTGCWPCSMGIRHKSNNIELLRHTHPHLWELIMVKYGLSKEIMKFKKGWSEKNWGPEADAILKEYLEQKPCHFDIA